MPASADAPREYWLNWAVTAATPAKVSPTVARAEQRRAGPVDAIDPWAAEPDGDQAAEDQVARGGS